MAPDINPSIPVVGQPNSSEEPKIVTALTQLVAAVNNVDTAQLADAAVTAVKIEAQQAWQTIALGSGGTLAYYKDSLGMVHLRGDQFSLSGPLSNGAVFATLPAGYRPGVEQWFTLKITNSASNNYPLSITAGGAITLRASAVGSETFSFGMIHFRAEG